MDGVSPEGPQSFRCQRRPMDDSRESQGWTTACSIIISILVCSNVAGRTKERIAQSKRARAGSLVSGVTFVFFCLRLFATRTHNSLTTQLSMCLRLFLFLGGCRFFSSIFVPLPFPL